MDCWTRAIDSVLLPQLPELGEQQRALVQHRVVSRLYNNQHVVAILERMEAYLLKYAFRIPEHVVLVEDAVHIDEHEFDAVGCKRQIRYMEKEIIKVWKCVVGLIIQNCHNIIHFSCEHNWR
jgi:hypothetical protein